MCYQLYIIIWHKVLEFDWLLSYVAMEVTIDSKFTVDCKFYATDPKCVVTSECVSIANFPDNILLCTCCGSVDKTMDSQLWGPQFESAGSGSSALGQGTLSSLPSPSERT